MRYAVDAGAGLVPPPKCLSVARHPLQAYTSDLVCAAALWDTAELRLRAAATCPQLPLQDGCASPQWIGRHIRLPDCACFAANPLSRVTYNMTQAALAASNNGQTHHRGSTWDGAPPRPALISYQASLLSCTCGGCYLLNSASSDLQCECMHNCGRKFPGTAFCHI